MAATPDHIQEILDELRVLMLEWDANGELGEIAAVRGPHQWQVEDRPRRKRKAVKHEQPGRKPIVRMTGNV